MQERQQLYEKFTKPMSGKNLKMLVGYDPQNNNKIPDKLANAYKQATADPKTRYNTVAFGFDDLLFKPCASASRAVPLQTR